MRLARLGSLLNQTVRLAHQGKAPIKDELRKFIEAARDQVAGSFVPNRKKAIETRREFADQVAGFEPETSLSKSRQAD